MKQAPLPDVARLALTAGRLLLEGGANGRSVHGAIHRIAKGYGCDSAEALCQHAGIIVMLRRGDEHCSQMGRVGEHGVNVRRRQALHEVVNKVAKGKLSCKEAQEKIEQVPKTTPAYPVWLVCLATGIACAAFGRLLQADWVSFLPTVLGASVGQYIRHHLFHRKFNIFMMGGTVSLTAAFLAGVTARLAGSQTLMLAMIASVLLLVPGPASLNTQFDILDGRPNLGAARGLRIVFLLLFMTLGLFIAQSLVGRLPLP